MNKAQQIQYKLLKRDKAQQIQYRKGTSPTNSI